MGLLRSLLTLPVSGPVRSVVWVAEQVAETAQRQVGDDASLQRELAELERRHAFGELTDEELEQAEEDLWERLEPEPPKEDRDGR